MKTLEINIPEGLLDYLQKLVDEGNFESVEVFISHASYWLAELYGFGEKTEGKSLSDLIAEQIISKTGKVEKVAPKAEPQAAPKAVPQTAPKAKAIDLPNQDLILESFGSAKFMYEDAIFASCQFAALKQGNPPLSKEEFIKTLEKMEEVGILTQMKQAEKTMWKKLE
ncbi:MAG: hypothetical protein H7645_01035 [Candidatus Heimdallarchaeota archaeon]|nr:hypothetical protein [Candidatus Heimdallarchaeota archaeon]MCK4768899.1 hypothetical protein [Candidatus Heimdallarchaeota archaeon]